MQNFVKHKSIGTAPAGAEITFHLTVSRRLAVQRASLSVFRDGGAETPVPLEWRGFNGDSDVYSATWRFDKPGLFWYRFFLDSRVVGEGADGGAELYNWEPFRFTVYEKIYEPPEFLHGGIMYQIMVDRFYSAGKKKTKEGCVSRGDWYGVPVFEPDAKGEIRNNDFFGGDIQGIIEKLPYLKTLNVSSLYLNPIFEAASNHKYDTGDYMKIDPCFGTEEEFSKLIEEAGKLGISVILDGVFSHTGADSRYFDKFGNYGGTGAYRSRQSEYSNWYRFTRYPDEYESWWGIKTLPNVNELDPSYNAFINGAGGVIEHWQKKGIAGWRLDVADELPGGFIKNLARAAKGVRSDAVVLGEVWEDASVKISYGERREYLLGRELDSVMNYPFKKAIIDFMANGSAEQFARSVSSIAAHYPPHILHCLMNILGTHDTPRILTTVSGVNPFSMSRRQRAEFRLSAEEKRLAKRRLFSAALLQFTLPGLPCVYYGDEAGLEGFEDPFNRMCYPWGREDGEILEFYRALGTMRTSFAALKRGWLRFLYKKGHVCIFERADNVETSGRRGAKTVSEALIVGVNTGGADFPIIPEQLLPDDSGSPRYGVFPENGFEAKRRISGCAGNAYGAQAYGIALPELFDAFTGKPLREPAVPAGGFVALRRRL